jgi:tetratricopeptide (TPR) repeat protein
MARSRVRGISQDESQIIKDTVEVEGLFPLLESRAELAKVPVEKLSEVVGRRLELVGTSPAQAFKLLGSVLYRDDIDRAAADRLRAALAKAYARVYVDASIEQMVKAYEERQLDKVLQLATAILTREPDNQKVLEFLSNMDDRLRAALMKLAVHPKQVTVFVRVPAPAPPIENKPAPVPPKVPSLIEKALAQAHYNRGLAAYSLNDLKQASLEWRQAVALDPDNAKLQHSLRRLTLESPAGPGTL